MEIQRSSNASSTKTTSLVPNGPTEAVITFTCGSQADALQPTDATIIWYHSLGETERQIKGVQLHEIASGQPPFVVLLMNDDSFLSLKISQTGNSWDRLSVDVIRLTEISDLAPPSIQVDFLRTLSKEDAYVDLKFVVALCCGILGSKSLQNPESGMPMLIPQCQRLFALALFVSVVRKRLPVNESLIKNFHSLSYVDNFWLEVLSSCQCYGQLLWEETLVDKMYQEVRHWIHSTIYQQLEASMPLMTAKANGDSDSESRRKKKHAESIAAWLEFTACKSTGKPSAAGSWDAAWDEAWRLEWSKPWKANWGKGVQVPSLPHLSDPIPAGNPLSGYAAGRAAIEVALVAQAVEIPMNSLLQAEIAGFQDNQDNYSNSQDSEHNWLGSWHSIRHPDLKQPGKWLPVWEAARNMAWALAWENLEPQGESSQQRVDPGQQSNQARKQRKFSLNTQSHHTTIPENKTALQPRSQDSLSISSANTDNLFRSRVQKFAAILKRLHLDHGENPSMLHKVAVPNIQILSQAAWREASGEDLGATSNHEPNLAAKANEYIETRAKKARDLLKQTTSQPLHLKLPSEATWGNVFATHWKDVWQKSWEHAWKKVMLETESKFELWRCQSDSRPKGDTLISNIGELPSYNELKKYLGARGTKEDDHWRIRSALKALNLLRNALLHSVPICYQEAMTISHFPDRVRVILRTCTCSDKTRLNSLSNSYLLTPMLSSGD
ncbi:hypothetical protein ACGC1H_007592 [Rhizoctonia solani]